MEKAVVSIAAVALVLLVLVVAGVVVLNPTLDSTSANQTETKATVQCDFGYFHHRGFCKPSGFRLHPGDSLSTVANKFGDESRTSELCYGEVHGEVAVLKPPGGFDPLALQPGKIVMRCGASSYRPVSAGPRIE